MEKSFFSTYFPLFCKLRSALHSLLINSCPRIPGPHPSMHLRHVRETLPLKLLLEPTSLHLFPHPHTRLASRLFFFTNSLDVLAFVLTTQKYTLSQWQVITCKTTQSHPFIPSQRPTLFFSHRLSYW